MTRCCKENVNMWFGVTDVLFLFTDKHIPFVGFADSCMLTIGCNDEVRVEIGNLHQNATDNFPDLSFRFSVI